MPQNFRSLDELLFNYQCKEKGSETHTRIPDHSQNIYGGKYRIPTEVLPMFYKLYNKKVFVQKKNEYLTEKQLKGESVLAIDFDFRYNVDVNERQHTEEHITDIIGDTAQILNKHLIINQNEDYPFHVIQFL